jgi:phenylacetate-coenzyme A ligase PaaK-like adenylate-forming protein
MDELLVEVEPDAAHGDAERLATFGGQCARDLHKVLGVRVKVATVVPGTFPRTDFKARRVVDDRYRFSELNAKLKE